MLASHDSLNSTRLLLYSGICPANFIFIFAIPSKGRAGKLALPSGVQPHNMSSPKMLSCASLQAKRPILDTLMRSALRDKIYFTGISRLLSIHGGVLQGLLLKVSRKVQWKE